MSDERQTSVQALRVAYATASDREAELLDEAVAAERKWRDAQAATLAAFKAYGKALEAKHGCNALDAIALEPAGEL